MGLNVNIDSDFIIQELRLCVNRRDLPSGCACPICGSSNAYAAAGDGRDINIFCCECLFAGDLIHAYAAHYKLTIEDTLAKLAAESRIDIPDPSEVFTYLTEIAATDALHAAVARWQSGDRARQLYRSHPAARDQFDFVGVDPMGLDFDAVGSAMLLPASLNDLRDLYNASQPENATVGGKGTNWALMTPVAATPGVIANIAAVRSTSKTRMECGSATQAGGVMWFHPDHLESTRIFVVRDLVLGARLQITNIKRFGGVCEILGAVADCRQMLAALPTCELVLCHANAEPLLVLARKEAKRVRIAVYQDADYFEEDPTRFMAWASEAAVPYLRALGLHLLNASESAAAVLLTKLEVAQHEVEEILRAAANPAQYQKLAGLLKIHEKIVTVALPDEGSLSIRRHELVYTSKRGKVSVVSNCVPRIQEVVYRGGKGWYQGVVVTQHKNIPFTVPSDKFKPENLRTICTQNGVEIYFMRLLLRDFHAVMLKLSKPEEGPAHQGIGFDVPSQGFIFPNLTITAAGAMRTTSGAFKEHPSAALRPIFGTAGVAKIRQARPADIACLTGIASLCAAYKSGANMNLCIAMASADDREVFGTSLASACGCTYFKLRSDGEARVTEALTFAQHPVVCVAGDSQKIPDWLYEAGEEFGGLVLLAPPAKVISMSLRDLRNWTCINGADCQVGCVTSDMFTRALCWLQAGNIRAAGSPWAATLSLFRRMLRQTNDSADTLSSLSRTSRLLLWDGSTLTGNCVCSILSLLITAGYIDRTRGAVFYGDVGIVDVEEVQRVGKAFGAEFGAGQMLAALERDRLAEVKDGKLHLTARGVSAINITASATQSAREIRH